MPKPGDRETHCKYGHDLTLPGARRNVTKGRRGGGLCRQCVADYNRARRGSTKSGPLSHFRGDEAARLAAAEQGQKYCPACRQAKDPDQFHRASKNRDGLHSWCKACASKRKRATYLKHGKATALRRRAANFGISVDDLEALIAKHGGRCGICAGPCPSGRQLAVDHDHRTGRVRGLLCANCNRGIGLLQDSAAVAQAAADYLRGWETDAASQPSVRNSGLSVAS